jgi:hypothetical protein
LRWIRCFTNTRRTPPCGLTRCVSWLPATFHIRVRRPATACSNLIRTSFYGECSGAMEITTHPDHISHCQTASSTSWSNRQTYRASIINTRRDSTNPELRDEGPLRAPRKSLRTSIKRQFVKVVPTCGDKCPQNGSRNDLTAPRTTLC